MQDELKVDMDWKPPASFRLEWEWMALDVLVRHFRYNNGKYFGRKSFKGAFTWEESCGGKGLHVRVKLPYSVRDGTALLLQFLLGDDRTRCRLNGERVKAGIKDWNVLFCRKIKRRTVMVDGVELTVKDVDGE